MGEHQHRPPWDEDQVISAVRLGFILGALFACLVGTAVVTYPSGWSALPGLGSVLLFMLGWGLLRNGPPGGRSSSA